MSEMKSCSGCYRTMGGPMDDHDYYGQKLTVLVPVVVATATKDSDYDGDERGLYCPRCLAREIHDVMRP